VRRLAVSGGAPGAAPDEVIARAITFVCSAYLDECFSREGKLNAREILTPPGSRLQRGRLFATLQQQPERLHSTVTLVANALLSGVEFKGCDSVGRRVKYPSHDRGALFGRQPGRRPLHRLQQHDALGLVDRGGVDQVRLGFGSWPGFEWPMIATV
jgi:hypothetical protein